MAVRPSVHHCCKLARVAYINTRMNRLSVDTESVLSPNAFKRSVKLPATTHTVLSVTLHSQIHSVSSTSEDSSARAPQPGRVGLPLRREQSATEIREASTERGRREKHKHVLCLRGYDWRLAQLPAARQRCPLSSPWPLPPIPVLDTLVTSFFALASAASLVQSGQKYTPGCWRGGFDLKPGNTKPGPQGTPNILHGRPVSTELGPLNTQYAVVTYRRRCVTQ